MLGGFIQMKNEKETKERYASGIENCKKQAQNLKQKASEKFLSKVYEQVGDDYTFLETYVTSKTKLWVIHNVCGHKYRVTPNEFTSHKRRCPKCANKKRVLNTGIKPHTLESIIESVKELSNDEYEVVSNEYENNKEKIWVRHKTCSYSYLVRYNDFQQGYRCPLCADMNKSQNNSKPIQDIKSVLDFNKIEYESEVSFEECVDKRFLPFDILVYTDKVNDEYFLIEYDGQQHSDPNAQFGGTKEERLIRFELTQKHDTIKNAFCEENSIKLYRISYKEDLMSKLRSILEENNLI